VEQDAKFFFSSIPLLRTTTVATGRKLLWPRATIPSLLLCRYSGSTVAMDRRHPSLLWYVVATGCDVALSVVVVTSSSNKRLTLPCPSLLGVTVATGNLMSDYLLLLDRFRFRHTYRHSQIQVYQVIIIRHIDKN
jgi:hypothetical protein